MKKIFFSIILLVFFIQYTNAQGKKNNSAKTISGFDLVDNSEFYNGKKIRVYVVYDSYNNYDKNLRYNLNKEESEGCFSPTQLKNLQEYIGSNDEYYSRFVTLYGATTKIIIRIPLKIINQIPNIDNLGYVNITGKWFSEKNTLIATNITR